MTSLVNTETGEIVETTITVAEVRASIGRVIDHVESIWDEWAWQVENQTWNLIGYASWDEMRRGEYGALTSVSAPRAERPELVSRFRNAGLTQRQTAETLGISRETVQRHDEPSYRPRETKAANDAFDAEIVEAELVDESNPKPLPKFSDWMTENTKTPEPGEASTASSPFSGSDERGEQNELPAVPPASVDLSDFINSDPTVRLTSWRKHFMAAIAKSSDLLLFTPDDVAENAGVDLINELERLASDLNNYVSRVRAKRPTHLTALRGGKQ